MRLTIAAIWAALLVFPALASEQKDKKDDPSQIGNRDVAKCLNFYTIDKEMALGKQLADEVARESKIDDDAVLGEFVNRVGQSLARNSDAKMPFTFRVIDGNDLNAFALPGGYVFVYTGLIKLASEEDEFAGVLAHEIAHVAARHMTCQESRAQLARGLGVVPGILLGGLGGLAARQAANAIIPMTNRAFSRQDEAEADYLGVQYMYAAGYDPSGAVSILEKLEALQKTQPGAVARVFAVHPMNADRIDKTEQEIQKILPPRDQYVVTTSEYREMRQRLIDREYRPQGAQPDNSPTLRRNPADDSPTLKRQD